jgi:CRP-like cAMP-binding protein
MVEDPLLLTPLECDLRDFRCMPLDVVRVRDSEIASIDPEAFRAAVISWCVAWHQVPAASLPDDDAVLCRLLGYGRDITTWLEIRAAGALRGYVKCTDGRLYHRVVAEKTREAWSNKKAQRDRTEAARLAKLAKQRGINAEESPSGTQQDRAGDYARNLSQKFSNSVTGSVADHVTKSVTETVTGSKPYKIRTSPERFMPSIMVSNR